MPLAGDDDRVDDGGALAGVGVADEEPVLLPYGRRADRVFDEVVVEPALAVAQMRGERFPVIEQIRAGLADQRSREMTRAQADGEPTRIWTVLVGVFPLPMESLQLPSM